MESQYQRTKTWRKANPEKWLAQQRRYNKKPSRRLYFREWKRIKRAIEKYGGDEVRHD